MNHSDPEPVADRASEGARLQIYGQRGTVIHVGQDWHHSRGEQVTLVSVLWDNPAPEQPFSRFTVDELAELNPPVCGWAHNPLRYACLNEDGTTWWDGDTGRVRTFATRAEAEAEAADTLRLQRETDERDGEGDGGRTLDDVVCGVPLPDGSFLTIDGIKIPNQKDA